MKKNNKKKIKWLIKATTTRVIKQSLKSFIPRQRIIPV